METSEHSEPLLIGDDIPWKTIEGEFCRVKQFLPLAIVESGKIRDHVAWSLPYASMRIEYVTNITENGLIVVQEALMPVNHKLDFRNLWDVFKERDVSTDEEVLVVYAPVKSSKLAKSLSGMFPSLVILLYPKGSLERLHEEAEEGKAEEWFKSRNPIARWDARPENLQ